MDPTLRARSSAPHGPDVAGELRAAWPIPGFDPGRGYATVATDGLRLLDALPLGPDHAVAVVRDADHGIVARPLVRDGSGWRVAGPGTGTAAELVAALSATDRGVHGAFEGSWRGGRVQGRCLERAMTADQTNLSVIVDDTMIVKWRTVAHATGERGLLLRRHLEAAGFDEVPPLLGALMWTGHGGQALLVDVDTLLPEAVDGWDWALGALEPFATGRATPPALGSTLGGLTARLHIGLARPSRWIGEPRVIVGADVIHEWQQSGRSAVAASAAIPAEDRSVVVEAQRGLLSAVDGLGQVGDALCIPIHGDLHIGQLVAWAGGLAVIDFDGPPGSAGHHAPATDRRPAARDVAQLLVSLDLLAVAVDQRTDGQARDRLVTWAQHARRAFLARYRADLARAGASDLLDERLLPPFIAEQLCRELLYADAALPRWRYAPVGALDWLYQGVIT